MVQIDGLSGTGKSTLCAELLRRGYHGVDADEAFGHFADPATGLPTNVECRANWMWDGKKLRGFAPTCREGLVFICGGAMNQNEFADLFAQRFTLHIDGETMRKRLLTRTNNDFGKNPAELAEQLALSMHVLADAERIGSTIIDATRAIDDVADDILRLACLTCSRQR